MLAPVWFSIAAAAAYVYAAAIYPLLSLRGAAGRWLAILLGCVPLLFPLLIPREMVVARALAGLVCTDAFLKLIDMGREVQRAGTAPIPYASYLHFLIPYPLLLVVYQDKERAWEGERRALSGLQLLRIIVSASIVLAMFWLVLMMTASPLLQESFWLDHAVKLFLFVILMEAGSQLMVDLDRALGYETEPPMRHFFLSRTPGEFWLRYNTRVHRWLELNVFRPSGGRRHPVRGVLMVFLVSATFHEVMFDIATSHADGYQFLFFMLQAPAVLLSPALERFAQRRGLFRKVFAHVVTIAWFYVTSILFFRGVERVFWFTYASEPWLR